MVDTAYVINISSLKTHLYSPENKHSVIMCFLTILTAFMLQKWEGGREEGREEGRKMVQIPVTKNPNKQVKVYDLKISKLLTSIA